MSLISEIIGVRSTVVVSIPFKASSNSDILFLIMAISLSVIFILFDNVVLILDILFEMFMTSLLYMI